MEKQEINQAEEQRRLMLYFLTVNFVAIASGFLAGYLIDLLAGAIMFTVAMLVMIYVVFVLEK